MQQYYGIQNGINIETKGTITSFHPTLKKKMNFFKDTSVYKEQFNIKQKRVYMFPYCFPNANNSVLNVFFNKFNLKKVALKI